MSHSIGRILGLAAAIIVAAATSGAGEALPTRYEFTRIRMGVPFNITVYADDEASANSAADAAYRRIKELNEVFSDYDPRSEVSRLLQDAKPGEPVKVSSDLLTVLDRARVFSEASDGAFDVTVGPVVKLWRRAWRSKEKPSQDIIDDALSKVGFRKLDIDTEQSIITLRQHGMQLDFGAIAKGYACDEALAILRSHGMPSALVEAGGDMACGEAPPGRSGWTIAVEPLAEKTAVGQQSQQQAPLMLSLTNCGVASSGDTYQFVEFDGVRYSHIVDPKTGIGLSHHSHVTVIAKDATSADALASAVSVLGAEAGLPLIEATEGVEVLLVTILADGTRREVMSPGFTGYLRKEPTSLPEHDR